MAHGLPVEGTGAAVPTALSLARVDVATCALEDLGDEVASRIDASPYGFALVISASRVVLGRVRRSVLSTAESPAIAEALMEPGPSTLRPHESLEDLRDRLSSSQVNTLIVTDPEGKLLGVVRRSDVKAPTLGETERRRRARHRVFWQIVNPPTRLLAGYAPWWVLLETHGRRTGKRRRTPLARGPVEGDLMWLSSVHGRHAQWVRNLEAAPQVRVKLSGRWYDACATVHPYDQATARRFNLYARSGPRTLGIDPALVRLELRR